MKLELMNHRPFLVVIRELLFKNECNEVKKFLEPQLGFPPGRMKIRKLGDPNPKNDWTMKK